MPRPPPRRGDVVPIGLRISTTPNTGVVSVCRQISFFRTEYRETESEERYGGEISGY